MPAKPTPPPDRIYQIRITLQEIAPPIWRRLEAPNTLKMSRLHLVLQVAMGWTNSHLHEFRAGGRPSAMLAMLGRGRQKLSAERERKNTIEEIAPEIGSVLGYAYDFGDGWEHDILVEQILEPQPKVQYPRCVAGARACPPEDCGGPWGYENLLAALAEPDHPEHEEMKEWIGEEYDPEAFDLDAVNADLRRLR